MLLSAQQDQLALSSGTPSGERKLIAQAALPFESQFDEAVFAYRRMLEMLLLSNRSEIAAAARKLAEANKNPTRPTSANVRLAYRTLYLKVWKLGNKIEKEQVLIVDWYRRGIGRLTEREKNRFFGWSWKTETTEKVVRKEHQLLSWSWSTNEVEHLDKRVVDMERIEDEFDDSSQLIGTHDVAKRQVSDMTWEVLGPIILMAAIILTVWLITVL